jgi:hypothetical protein
MDDFLRTVQSDWRNQPLELDQLEKRLRRHRWSPHAMLALEILGGLTGFAVGVWFFSIAVRTGALLFVLAAVVMLASMPAFTVFSIIARRKALRHEDDTPERVVRSGLARAEASLRAVRIGYLGVAVIAGFVAVLWLAQVAGAIHALGFVTFHTVTAAAVCTPYVLYLRWRSTRILRERAACERLMSELRDVSE